MAESLEDCSARPPLREAPRTGDPERDYALWRLRWGQFALQARAGGSGGRRLPPWAREALSARDATPKELVLWQLRLGEGEVFQHGGGAIELAPASLEVLEAIELFLERNLIFLAHAWAYPSGVGAGAPVSLLAAADAVRSSPLWEAVGAAKLAAGGSGSNKLLEAWQEGLLPW